MSREIEKKIKYCVYCGVDIGESKTYCPNCGKLVMKLEANQDLKETSLIQKPISKSRGEISRKCPGCGSIITSTILDQCPICDTTLEKIPQTQKIAPQKKPGLIFVDKKLKPEQNFILKKDQWNFREGLNKFGTCIYIYIIAYILVYFSLASQAEGDSIDQNIQTFIIGQIPEFLMGIYPLIYITLKNHSFIKLGFQKDFKKNITGVLIGIIGAISLLLLDFLFNLLISSLADLGLDFFDMETEINLQNQIIRDAEFLWVFLLTVLMTLGAISLEITYRGVLHNSLKQRFHNDIYTILVVASIYSIFMMVLYPNPTYFFLNFISFVILGIIWELSNGNIYSTLIASSFYSIILITLIYF
ncbi:MAG: type II CAAX prenyl endopeptidase Rce1 family protein [Promethearchaeota archaeon]